MKKKMEILKNGLFTENPVLILTARDAIEDRINGLDSGADDYLVKPFALAELQALALAALDHGARLAAA